MRDPPNAFHALGVVFPPVSDETDNPSGMPAARLTANASRLRRETLPKFARRETNASHLRRETRLQCWLLLATSLLQRWLTDN
jgi:hypothetical protein